METHEAANTDPAEAPFEGSQVPHQRHLRRPKIFSSASHAPRARRPTDAILLVLAVLGVALLSFPAPGPTKLDQAVTEFVASIPGLFGWFWEISYALLVVWALILLVAALVAKQRLGLFLDELVAGGLALGSSLLAGRLAGTDWSDSLHQVTSTSQPPVYLAVRLAIATAIVVTASPHLVRPLKRVGRLIIGCGAIAGIALGTTLPIGMTAGFLIGIGSAALVHVVVGSPGGRLTLRQVSDALADLGVEVLDLHDAPLEPSGVQLAVGRSPKGDSMLVKVFGRDAWDGQFLASAWASIWNKGGSPQAGSGRLAQVEHEAFVTLFAERQGVSVLPIVSAGVAEDGDALLVIETTGRPLIEVEPGDVDDDLLLRCWTLLADLRSIGVAHGHIDRYRLVIRHDDAPALGDFGDARFAAEDGALHADMAQLLVTTALVVGQERALAAAAASIGDDGLASVLPYLQPAVLDRATTHEIRERDWKLKDLRTLAAERTGNKPPALEPIRRVTWQSFAKLAIIGFLAYALISAVAHVGIQNLIDEFQNANWWWLLAALILTPFAQIPQAFSTMGATVQALKFGPVLMLQYGVQFIALAVPSSAARVALEVRFFERQGVPAGGAVSIGMLDSFSTFVLQMLLIVIILASGSVNFDTSSLRSSSSSDSSSSSGVTLWQVAVVLLVLAGIAVLVLPRFRELRKRFWAGLKKQASEGRRALRVLRQPTKWLYLLGGNLIAQVMLAIILGICLRAFGYSASLAALILVNTFVSLFAGFMPVPGGVGVSEAAYTACLIAIGIPEAAATSTAIAFRMVTFYLPPLWGTFAMRWMKQHSYL